jgi:tetratricopeptide (TPR) repeat protein
VLLLVIILAGGIYVLFYSNTQIGRSFRTSLYRQYFSNFPYPRKDFIGREEDVKKLMELLDFSNTQYDIVNIIGPPGIGKSSLAVFIGNEMIMNGAIVHYVNMAEFPDGHLKQVLAEKILAVENATFDGLQRWASNRYWNNLIVLDNCDECINEQKEAFQKAITEILHFSNSLKILMTSREVVYFLEKCYEHQVKPLSERAACSILERKVPLILNEAETKRIVELTDAIPLALQIVGSLLGIKVAPPTPRDIIIQLEKHPIPTLSNPKLSVTMQRSIELSYKYLSPELQGVGRCIAYFPGSLTKAYFTELCMQVVSQTTHKTPSIDNLSSSLNELVTRSLLEFNEHTGRYYFHRLIKEFFLLEKNHDEENWFDLLFHEYHSSLLCSLTAEYIESPKGALATLDKERHNFQHYLATIHYSQAVRKSADCFYQSLHVGYLSSRISPAQLETPVWFTVSFLQDGLLAQTISPQFKVDAFKHFIDFTGYSSYLIRNLHGRDQAFQWLSHKVEIIEWLGMIIPGTNEHYIKFYTKFLLDFESELDENTTKLFHERILKRTNGSIFDCFIGLCKYYHIGDTYFKLREYGKSARFYEKSIDTKEFNKLPTAARVNLLFGLRRAYNYLGGTTNISKVNTKLLDELPAIMDQSSSQIYLNFNVFDQYVEFLSVSSNSSVVLALKTKIYDAFIDNDVHGNPTHALKLAQIMYKYGAYQKAVDMSSHALKVLETANGSVAHEMIGLLTILGKSTYHIGNIGRANEVFVKAIDYLVALNLTVPYTIDFAECCSHLLFLRNFDYVSNCFPLFLQTAQKFYMYPAVIFRIEFGRIEETVSEPVSTRPDNQYPEIIQHSKSKELLFDSERDVSPQLTYKYPLSWLFYFLKNKITTFLEHFLYTVLSYNYVILFLNIMIVFIKLYLLYYCCFRFLLWCIKIILRLLYFILGSLLMCIVFVVVLCLTL